MPLNSVVWTIPNGDLSGVYARLMNFNMPSVWPAGSPLNLSATLEWSFLDFMWKGDGDFDYPHTSGGYDGVAEFNWWYVGRFYIDLNLDGVWQHTEEINCFTEGIFDQRTGEMLVNLSVPAQYREGRRNLTITVRPMVRYYYHNVGEGGYCHTDWLNKTWTDQCACGTGIEVCSANFYLREPSVDIWEVGVDVTPPEAHLDIVTVPPFVAPKLVNFDASGSTAGGAEITQYHWNFGDGATQTTGNPYIEHVYTSPGTYTVSVTLVTSVGEDTAERQLVIDAALPDIFFNYSDCYFPSGMGTDELLLPVLKVTNQGGAGAVTVGFEAEGHSSQLWSGTIPGYESSFDIPLSPHYISWYLGYTPTQDEYKSIDFYVTLDNGVEVDSISYTFKVTVGNSPPPVYRCPYCDAEFDTQAELDAHIEDAHGGPHNGGGLATWPFFVGAGVLLAGAGVYVLKK